MLRLHRTCSFLPSYQAEENNISSNSCFTMCAPTSLEVVNSNLFWCSLNFQSQEQVRDKFLILLDTWQEASNGGDGRFPQFFRTCKDLQVGITMPQWFYGHDHCWTWYIGECMVSIININNGINETVKH